ncbi:MAG: hypothetical protein JWN94_1031 [Betaproteobacteria bacterium]|nr:hypothetical protein [Betaproteobacteria bacterium]
MAVPTVTYTTINGNKYVQHNSGKLLPARKSQATGQVITPVDLKKDGGGKQLIQLTVGGLYEDEEIASQLGKI